MLFLSFLFIPHHPCGELCGITQNEIRQSVCYITSPFSKNNGSINNTLASLFPKYMNSTWKVGLGNSGDCVMKHKDPFYSNVFKFA